MLRSQNIVSFLSKDCPPDATHKLTCLPGPHGGGAGHDPEHTFSSRNCSTPRIQELSEGVASGLTHDLLCLSDALSPYLGVYYEERPLLETKAHYDLEVERLENLQHKGFEDRSATGQLVEERHPLEYRHGSSLATVFDFDLALFGKVQLPVQTLSGQCLSAPLRHLEPLSSSCTHLLTAETCVQSRLSFLDHTVYLTGAASSFLGPVERVLTGIGSDETVPTLVRVYTSNSAFKYLTLSGAGSEQRPRPGENGADTLADLLSVLSSGQSRPSSNRFHSREFKHDLTRMEAGTIEPVHLKGDICKNVVLEVEYEFEWRGRELTGLKVDVLLGNLSVKGEEEMDPLKSSKHLNQFFSAKFVHQVEKATEEEDVFETSGNPGYVVGKPLIVGTPDVDSSEIFVESSGFQTWVPASSSLCRDSSVTPVNFGQDTRSGCFVQLSRDNFTDCETLAESILLLQDSLLTSSHVARGGFPNLTHGGLDDFIEIIYEQDEDASNATLDYPVKACLIPDQAQVKVLYTRSKLENAADSVLRVAGIKVSPINSLWTWTCVERGPEACVSVQNYEISATVRFEEVPLVWHHENTSRFWVQQDNGLCEEDRCWSEMFAPFTHDVRTGDEVSYVTMWAIIITFVSVIILFATKEDW